MSSRLLLLFNSCANETRLNSAECESVVKQFYRLRYFQHIYVISVIVPLRDQIYARKTWRTGYDIQQRPIRASNTLHIKRTISRNALAHIVPRSGRAEARHHVLASTALVRIECQGTAVVAEDEVDHEQRRVPLGEADALLARLTNETYGVEILPSAVSRASEGLPPDRVGRCSVQGSQLDGVDGAHGGEHGCGDWDVGEKLADIHRAAGQSG